MNKYVIAGSLALLLTVALGLGIYLLVSADSGLGELAGPIRRSPEPNPGVESPVEEVVELSQGSLRIGAGELTIAGRVVDGGGGAIAGAQVVLFEQTGELENLLDDSIFESRNEAARSVRDRARRLAALLRSRPRMETDAEGSFAFGGLSSGAYRVAALGGTSEGLSRGLSPAATEMLVLDRESPRTGLSLELKHAATIRGVCVTAALDPVGDARVTVAWRPDDEDLASYRGASPEEILAILLTPESAAAASRFDGAFTLSGLLPGDYTLTAEARGHARAVLRDVPTDGPEIQVLLEAELIVHGEVIDAEENPIAGAEVALSFLSSDAGDFRSIFRSGFTGGRGGERGGDDENRRRSEALHRAQTDREGAFEIRGLARGTYRVEAESEGYQKGIDPFFSLTRESSEEDRTLVFQLVAGHVIEGVVLDETGQPVGDVEVLLRREGDLPSEEEIAGRAAGEASGEAEGARPERGERRGFGGRGRDGGRGRGFAGRDGFGGRGGFGGQGGGFGGRGGFGGQGGRFGGQGGGEDGDGGGERRPGGEGPVGSPGIRGVSGLTTALIGQESPEEPGAGQRGRGFGGRGDRGGDRNGERGDGRGRGDRNGERGDGRGRDEGRFLGDFLERFGSRSEAHEKRTDADGRFRFTTLPPGIYRIEIRSNRFLTYTKRGIETDGEALEIRLEAGKAIRGRIVDASSSGPVPNATVFLYAERSRRVEQARSGETQAGADREPEPSADSGEDSRREGGGRFGGFRRGDTTRRGEGGFRLVRTDGEGRFVASPLSAQRYRLGVSASGYLRTDGPTVEADAKDEVVVSIDRSGLVRGRVLDTNGVGVAGLRVALARDRSAEAEDEEGRRGFGRGGFGRGGGRTEYLGRSVTTDANGDYSLSPDRSATVRVVASGDPFLPGRSEPLTVNDPTAVIDGIDIVLQRSGTVAGTVTGSGGLPLARATVELRPRPEESTAEDGETDPRERMRQRFESFRGGVSARTDATGHYEASGLTEGRYELRVRASGHLDLTTEPFPVSLGEEKRMDVELEAEQYLAGTVRARDGTPIESAEVSTVTAGDDTERGGRGDFFRRNQRAVTNATGGFRIGKLESGSHDLRAVARGYASTMMQGMRAPADRIEIVLDPLVHLSGVVLGASTRLPVPSFRMRLVAANGDALDRRERESLDRWRSFDDPEGVFLLEGLPPGSYLLQVDAPEYLPVSGLPLAISPGSPVENFAVYLPEGGVIAGLVVDSRGQAVPEARVEARVQSTDAETGETSYSGYRSSLSSSRGRTRFSRDRGGESPRGSTERSRGSTRGSPRSGRSYSMDDGTFIVRGLPDGIYRILVTHSDLIAAEAGDFTIRTGADGSSSLAEVRVVLKDGATVRGRVLGLSADARAFVSLRAGTSSKSAVIDSTGRFELRGLPPGSYELQARLFGGRSSRQRGGERAESPSSATLTLPIEIGENDTVIDDVNVSFR